MLSEQFDVPAEKGPADLKRLPAFFGQADARSRYGARDVRVFAEINNVPHLDRERILERRPTTATPAPTSSTSGSRSTATGSRKARR